MSDTMLSDTHSEQGTINQAMLDFTPEEMDQLVLDFMQNAKTLKDIRGLTTENMEVIYSVAYNSYNAGNLEQARKIFEFLCYFDHLEHKYWMGLAATKQLLKDFSGAIDAYSFAALLDIHDPRAPFHAANCHIAIGNREAAISGLTATIEFSGSRPEWASLKSQAEAMMSLLETNPTA